MAKNSLMSLVHYLPFQLNGSVMVNQRKHKVLSTSTGFWITLMSLRSVAQQTTWPARVDPNRVIMLRKIMGTQKAQAELQVKLRSESLEQGRAWSWGKVLDLLGTIWDRWEKRRQKKDSNLFCRKGPASTRSSHSLSFPFLTSLSPFFLPYLPHPSPLFLLLSLLPGSSRPSPSFSRNRAIMEEHPATWKLSLPLAAAW